MTMLTTSLPPLRLTVDTLDSIRSNIAAYAGGPAIARELIQNADDAGATTMEFAFWDDRLVVRNNSAFKSQDFDAIIRIGSGSKRADQESTGTWGTGFLSVYQLTDYPEILSAGRRIRIDPTGQEFPQWGCEVLDATEFHFKWRKTPTDISEQIEADVWLPERIKQFEQELLPEIYRTLPFLRSVKTITLRHGTKLLCEVTRQLTHQERLPDGSGFERWDFTITNQARNSKIHPWLFYRGQLSQGFSYKGRQIKGQDFAIGIPCKTGRMRRTDGSSEGLLYNYLPTEIDTGFNFHIQGDFFPDANRKSILKGDGSDKSRWNESIIQGIAGLFARNVLHLRERVMAGWLDGASPLDPAQRPAEFYHLLPIKSDPRHPYLAPIVEAFRQAAHSLPLVFTTDQQWTVPPDLRNTGSPFRQLVEDYMPGIAPSKFPSDLFEFLKTVGSRALQGRDFLDFLRTTVRDGVPLEQAPPVVNSREKLYSIFDFFTKKLNPEERSRLMADLKEVPLCLDANQRLFAFDRHAIYRADAATRELLPPGEVWLADAEFQGRFNNLLAEKLQEFGIAQMVDYLNGLAPQNIGLPVSQAHPALNSRLKLGDLSRYLIKHRVYEQFQSFKIAPLPLLVDESHRIQPIAGKLYLADKELREFLGPTGLMFVSGEIENEPDRVTFLQWAGTSRLDVHRLIGLLPSWYGVERVAEGVFAQPDFLIALYGYLAQHSTELKPAEVTRLRELPFVLTQQGRLAALNAPAPLSLPPAAANEQLQALSDLLQLDNLVSERVLNAELRQFFLRTLNTPELNTLHYIGAYVCPNYNRPTLTHAQRLDLFRFIERTMPKFNQGDGPQVLASLRETALVRCLDDQYRKPGEVYFPSDELNRLLPDGYPTPHPAYGLFEGATSLRIFERLSLQSEVLGRDLVATVEKTVRFNRAGPQSKAYEYVRHVYEFLDANWDETYQFQALALSPLQNLKWLPATTEGDTNWYAPSQLYPATWRELVESQVKLIPFRQARRSFSDWLTLNVEPKLADVVNHLLYLSREGIPLNVSRMYTHLNERYNDPQIERLKNEAVIYDERDNRYWKPERVFLANFVEDFGSYHLYLADNPFANLFQRLGVRPHPDGIGDYTRLLSDISHKVGRTNLDDEDKRLVQRAYERLSDHLSEAGNPPIWVRTLQQERLVLDTTGQLYQADEAFFSDSENFRKQFEPDSLRLVDVTSKGKLFLEGLGVQGLSQVVKRNLVEAKSPQTFPQLRTRLQELRPQFERIIEHYRKKHSFGWRDLNWVNTVEVCQVEIIRVQYCLPGLDGHITSEDAFYNEAEKKLYFQKNGSDYALSLARELSVLLNPSLDRADLMPHLERLLASKAVGEAAHRLLDRYDISRLATTEHNLSITEETRQEAVVRMVAEQPSLFSANEIAPLPDKSAPFVPSIGPEKPVQATLLTTKPISPGEIIELLAIAPSAPTIPVQIPAEVVSIQAESVPSGTPSISETPPVETPIPASNEFAKKATAPIPESASASPAAASIPAFQGELRPRVPYIPTDYEGLRTTYGKVAIATASDEALNWQEQTVLDKETQQDEPDEQHPGAVTNVRFVLSFQMRYNGFLPLNTSAKKLLEGQSGSIECETDFGQRFPLYIDPAREIIYNQADLPAFLASRNIPAGGIVYLERVHDRLFRLYYKHDPHTVPNVRIAFLEDGKLQYEMLEQVEVECETEDLVFTAEKRLEDSAALFVESYGKKSVFETLIDVFEANDALGSPRQSEARLFQQVFMIRMVSRYTIRQELYRRPCFVDCGNDLWKFESTKVLLPIVKDFKRSQPTTKSTISVSDQPKAETTTALNPVAPAQDWAVPPPSVNIFYGESLNPARLLEQIAAFFDQANQQDLTLILNELRPIYANFVRLIEGLYRRQAQTISAADALFGTLPAQIEAVLSNLRQDLEDWQAQSRLESLLRDVLSQAVEKGQPDQADLALILQAGSGVWQRIIRPALTETVEQLERERQYGLAGSFLALDQQYTARDLTEQLKHLSNRQEAYDYYLLCKNDEATVEDKAHLLRDALRLDSTLVEARKLLDGQVQLLIGQKLEQIRTELIDGQTAAALQEYAQIKTVVNGYQPYLFNKDLFADFDGQLERIFSQVYEQLATLDKEAAHLSLTALYVNLPKSVQTAHWLDYVRSLTWLGRYYAVKSCHFEALLVCRQAYTLWEQHGWQNDPTLLLQLRRLLSQIYARLELWADCHRVRQTIVSTISVAERIHEQAKLSEAYNKRTGGELIMLTAHNNYLTWLRQFQSNQSELTLALTPAFVAGQIAAEDKTIANRG